MSVPTRGLSDMLDALTGRNQDDENKSKIHVTDEVQMHLLAASAGGFSSTLCLPGLPSASMATNIAQDQQNTWKMLMDMQQQMISFQTGLMRALETATVAATAARGAADAAQGSGRPSGPPESASAPNVRFGQSTTRIHPIKELHDEALKYFEKQALVHERNVQKLVRTQKEIHRLHVCDQCDGTKQTQRAEIHLPTWYISVQGAFGRCGDERGLAGVIGERLCFIIHDSERHELEKRDEHQPSREQHLHPKSDTTGSDCSSGLRQSIILETGFPPVVREPQVQTARMARLRLGGRGPPRS